MNDLGVPLFLEIPTWLEDTCFLKVIAFGPTSDLFRAEVTSMWRWRIKSSRLEEAGYILTKGKKKWTIKSPCRNFKFNKPIHHPKSPEPKMFFKKKIWPQEVQVDQTLPIGRIGNPELMDHPKDQPLCLVDCTSRMTLPKGASHPETTGRSFHDSYGRARLRQNLMRKPRWSERFPTGNFGSFQRYMCRGQAKVAFYWGINETSHL